MPISPPFQDIPSAQIQETELDAAEGKIWRLSSGSSVVVAPNSFVDKKGKPITGKIKLHYKEFRSAADIVTSGIPMTFQDEKGVNQHMQSAGMFELKGTANGEEIAIASDKSVQVNMASSVKGAYDFFYLEETATHDQISAGSFIPKAMAQNPTKPVPAYRWAKLKGGEVKAPEETDSKTVPFQLKFDTKDNPETKFLDSLAWHYVEDEKLNNPLAKENRWVLEKKWKGIEIGKPKYRSILLPNKNQREYAIRYDGATIKIERKSKPPIVKKSTHVIDFDVDKGLLLYYLLDSTSQKFTALKQLHLKTGQEKAIQLKCPHETDNHHDAATSADHRYAIIKCGDEIHVWDLASAKVIAKRKFDNVYNFQKLEYKNHILIETERAAFVIWDWQNDKILLPDFSKTGELEFVGYFNNSTEHPLLILTNREGHEYLYNWEKSTLVALTKNKNSSYSYFVYQSPFIASYRGYLIYENDTLNLENFVWDLEGKVLFKTSYKNKVDFFPIGDKDPAKKSLLITNDSSLFMIMRPDGKKIDLLPQFPMLKRAFSWSGQLLTLSLDNKIGVWDIEKAKLKYQVPIVPAGSIKYAMLNKKDRITIFYGDHNMQELDNAGTVLAEYQNYEEWPKASPIHLEGISEGDYLEQFGWDADETYPLPEDVYRLSLYSDSVAFFTYIKYDPKIWDRLERYTSGKRARLQQVQDQHKKEEELVRTFEINKFGIYNWDIFYDKSDVVTLNATFALDNDSFSTKASEPILFQITGSSRNAVIKNPGYRWEQFQFKPSDPNLLLMVLPNDRIAILSEDEFRKIDPEVVKKNGKYTFRLKVLDKLQSKEQLEQILKAGEKPAS